MITKFIFIAIFLLITAIIGYYWKKKELTVNEHFLSENTIIKENYTDIYDTFYSNIYDQLFNSNIKNEYEIYNIKKYALEPYKKQTDIYILDAGCGTGKHLKIIDKYQYPCIGLDNSIKMLEIAQKYSPGIKLVNGDFHNKSVFKRRKFSHITCLFYTIYYTSNPKKIFNNFNYWLKPNGYFCVHS